MSTGSKSKILIFIITVLLIANITMLWFYKKSEDEKRSIAAKNRFGLSPLLKDQLKFSDQQMKAFEELKNSHKEMVRPYFDSLKSSKNELYELLDNPSVTDSTISLYSSNIGRNQGEIDRRFFIYFQNVRKLCNQEQLVQFDTLIPPFLQKMINPPYSRNNRPSAKPASTNK